MDVTDRPGAARRFPLTPHSRLPTRPVGELMVSVCLALTPGIIAMVWQFGPGVLLQCGIAALTALLAEAGAQILRGRPPRRALQDYSALVTALLLGVSLPGLAPDWLIVVGVLCAILLGKQIYGGLGHNPFNPAMVGYAVLLIAFPREMTRWPAPTDLLTPSAGLFEAWQSVFSGLPPERLDALTGATPLDVAHTRLAQGLTIEAAHAGILAASRSGVWVNLGFLLGGLWLLRRKVVDWRLPAAVLTGLFTLSLAFFLIDPEHHATPLFHLFSGATMLAAFFIATDPVSAATTPLGRWLYGLGIGWLIFAIRAWGSYPDGVAFAVLLMNVAAPTLDRYTQPRVYGHSR
ncbi:MAG: RnfABCDGE type electron transport complex subunit D [Methylococcus sp.]